VLKECFEVSDVGQLATPPKRLKGSTTHSTNRIMPKTSINSTTSEVENEDGTVRETTQYRTTVPKDIAEAMDLDDATVEWTIKSANSVQMSVVARGDNE